MEKESVIKAFSKIWLWMEEVIDFEKREHSYQRCDSEHYTKLRNIFDKQMVLLRKHLTICEDIMNFITEVVLVNLYWERQRRDKINKKALRHK